VKLLLIEDSQRLRKSLSEGLRRSGFAVDLAADGEAGARFALATEYDVIVLDLMLPKVDGLSVLQALRDRNRQTPVLILSAKDQVQDRIRGLELGADDYLVKPFAFDELHARLQALIRRRYESRNPIIRLGRIELNTSLHQLRCAGVEIKLTPHELALLEYLALNRGRVITLRSLEDHLYASDAAVSSNAIEAHVSALRRKLRAASGTELVKTRRGFGYYIEKE
jgi:DNA-binding response OmpR family regulator